MLGTCLRFCLQNITSTPLGDPEVKLIDTKYRKLLSINMLAIHGHACLGFYVVQTIATSVSEMSKHQFRRAILSGDSSCR